MNFFPGTQFVAGLGYVETQDTSKLAPSTGTWRAPNGASLSGDDDIMMISGLGDSVDPSLLPNSIANPTAPAAASGPPNLQQNGQPDPLAPANWWYWLTNPSVAPGWLLALGGAAAVALIAVVLKMRK